MLIICTKFDDKLARVSEFTQCNSFVGTCMYGLCVWFDENSGHRYLAKSEYVASWFLKIQFLISLNNFHILNRFNLVYLVDLELVYVNFITLEE